MALPRFQLRSPYIYLSVILLSSILFTAYLVGTDREVFATLRQPLPSFGGGSHNPPPVEKPVGFHYNTAAVDVTIPPGVRIIGLVFFGRRELVKILDCYLKRNLKDNGGLLDEVVFAVNTNDEDDLAYLEDLLLSHPRYSKHVAERKYTGGYSGSWECVSEPESVYIKIDDDVIFFEDAAIPAVVKRLLENPQYFAVSANVVNNPALAWVHYSMGLYEPYWPELNPPASPPAPSWHASDLPSYEGPPKGPPDFYINGSTAAPYKGHRWLPVRLPQGQNYDISLTPASTLTYDAFGPSLRNWAAAAQTHYSFLQHLEQGDTWRYKFDIWDYKYQRLSINFFAIRGRDILDVFPFPLDDESYLTTIKPKQVGRHVIVDGTGLAVHFAFGPQYRAHENKGLTWTDLLSRYRAYTADMFCPLSANETSNAASQ